MDNFSRFILSWRIAEVVSAQIRVDTIREAYNKFKKSSQHITLITDGGPENDNNMMHDFTFNETQDFNTVIALKDIPFSNAIIEVQNKLFKYHYLFRQEYNNGDDLRNIFGDDVYYYNLLRPHVSLKGYTPEEAHSGLSGMKELWANQIQQARKERLLTNKKEICMICQ